MKTQRSSNRGSASHHHQWRGGWLHHLPRLRRVQDASSPIMYLEPEKSVYKWLFKLDDFKSLHKNGYIKFYYVSVILLMEEILHRLISSLSHVYPIIYRVLYLYTSQAVQDFFHQQYVEDLSYHCCTFQKDLSYHCTTFHLYYPP